MYQGKHRAEPDRGRRIAIPLVLVAIALTVAVAPARAGVMQSLRVFNRVFHTHDLTGVGTRWSPLGIDDNHVQRRVDGICPNGSAIVRVDVSGAVICNPGTSALSTFNDGGADLPPQGQSVVVSSLAVPAGMWVILAKGIAEVAQGTSAGVSCRLEAEEDYDIGRDSFSEPTFNASSTITMTVVHAAPSQFMARVTCEEFYGDAKITWVKVTAIQLGALSNTSG